jgi:hypothetical protein
MVMTTSLFGKVKQLYDLTQQCASVQHVVHITGAAADPAFDFDFNPST